MESSTQAHILRAVFQDSAAGAAEGGTAARAAQTIAIAEFSAISGELGGDLAALGVALSESEQYHSDGKDWKRNGSASASTGAVGANDAVLDLSQH